VIAVNTVYLLGSGFSKAAGAPLGRELMERVFNQQDKPQINSIYRWISTNIFPDKENWHLICEIDELISRLSLHCHYNNKQCPQTSHILNMLTYELARSVDCYLDQEDRRIYRNFIARIKTDDVVISLNYDTILERCGILKRIKDLLKLHGSMSWSYCPLCQKIYNDARWQKGGVCLTCGSVILPCILPPQVIITHHIDPFLPLYSRALQYLQNARRLVIIGYSLPATDFDIKLLLKLGLGTTKKKSIPIYLINGPDNNPENYKFLRSHLIKIRLTAEEWLNLRVN